MLGSDVLTECVKVFGHDSVIGYSHEELDITSKQSIRFAFNSSQPQFVINCAAYTNVDSAEIYRNEAHEINVLGAENLAHMCRESDAKLIHFSTDQVFDGMSNRPWIETDKPNPLNYYAQTKWEGEMRVMSQGDHIIIRVQWLYGQKKERFTQLKGKKIFTPFSDQRGAPTWTRNIAQVIPKLLGSQGIFHFAYDDSASWTDVYQYVKETMGYSVTLEPKKTEEAKLPATRPLYCVMSNGKLKKELKVSTLGSWRVALAEFLEILSTDPQL